MISTRKEQGGRVGIAGYNMMVKVCGALPRREASPYFARQFYRANCIFFFPLKLMKKVFSKLFWTCKCLLKGPVYREERSLEELKMFSFYSVKWACQGFNFFPTFFLRGINLEEQCSPCSVFMSFTYGLTPVFVWAAILLWHEHMKKLLTLLHWIWYYSVQTCRRCIKYV